MFLPFVDGAAGRVRTELVCRGIFLLRRSTYLLRSVALKGASEKRVPVEDMSGDGGCTSAVRNLISDVGICHADEPNDIGCARRGMG